MSQNADVVSCDTGVAAAHFLSKAGVNDILIVDERPPLSFTSDQSIECYCNW
jgi:sarcosine oxidase, subunit beta